MSSQLALKLGTSTPNLFYTLPTSLFNELLLENASMSPDQRVTAGCQPRVDTPRPRLVGIETNPGPVPVAALASLAGLIAATVKKKKSSSKSSGSKSSRAPRAKKSMPRPPEPFVARASSSQVSVPAAFGTVTRNRAYNHTPFILSSRHIAATIRSTGAGAIVYSNADGVDCVSTFNTFTVDPLGNGILKENFASFPVNFRNLSKSFLQYRLKRLKLTYSPVLSTASAGGIVFAPLAEVAWNYGLQTYAQIAQCSTAVSAPIWETVSLDAVCPNGLTTEWKYMDENVPASKADLRLESPGSISVGFPGPQVANSTLGFLWYDYTIEFRGVALESAFGSDRDTDETGPSESSPPASVHDESKEEERGYYLPPQTNPGVSPPITRAQPARSGFFSS